MDNKLHPRLKTPLAYYGGKQSIIRHILPLIPPHEVYTEAFFGGGSVFFAKAPAKNETINDRLDLLVNFYRVLKNNYKSLKKRIDQTLLSRYDRQEAIKIIKKWETGVTNKGSRIDVAWATWFTFNFHFANKKDGGLKYSNDVGTAVPLQLIHKKERFTEHLTKRIENATIENRDALWVLSSRNVKNAFHEIDPPYLNADQGHYKGYTENDFINLLGWCEECKGKFLLHNYNSPILEDYIRRNGWRKKEVIHRIVAPRKSGPVKREIMVYNYDVQPDLFTQNFR